MKSSDQIRLDLLNALTELSRIRPDWRFGQMIANLATMAGKIDPGSVWDLEDEEALMAAHALIEHSRDNETVKA